MILAASINTINGIKWGYINKQGEFLIEPIYHWARQFQDNGLAVVTLKEFSGIIDITGRYIVEPIYQSIQEFSEGLAVIVDEKGFGVMDERGNLVTNESYNYIGDFKNGRALFASIGSEGRWLYGYLDTQGNVVIPANYEIAGDFKNGKAVVKIQMGDYAIIDSIGGILKNFNYTFVGNIGDGLLAFKENEKDKFGYIDEEGKVVVPAQFTSAETFRNERAIVNTADKYVNKYGFIDIKGNFVIVPKYNSIELLEEDMVSVGVTINKKRPYIGSKYAIADISGKFYTDFIYYGVSNFKKGLASAYDNLKVFFINKTGRKVLKLPAINGTGNLSFQGELIKADIDNRVSYMNKTGKIIYKQNTSISLNDSYIVKEKKYKPNRNYTVYYPQISGIANKKVEAMVNKILKEKSELKDIDSNDQLDYNYFGDFGIEFFKKNLLVLKFSAYNYPFGAAHGMPTEIYAHVDLLSGRFYELNNLFKKDSNYVEVLGNIIREQIESMGPDSSIWIEEYKGIKEDQPFYITEDSLNIYFNPYEIAPYAYGFPTFKIPYKEIEDIINLQGKFWNSFN